MNVKLTVERREAQRHYDTTFDLLKFEFTNWSGVAYCFFLHADVKHRTPHVRRHPP